MALYLAKRPGSPYWYIRGAAAGRRLYRSTKTTDRDDAEALKAELEAQIWQGRLHGARAVVTFDTACRSYLEVRRPGPGDARYVARLLGHFRGVRLAEIDQAALDRAYLALTRADAAPATRRRAVYDPLVAILNHAAKPGRDWCDRPNFERPRRAKLRVRWLTPAEAERLIAAAAPHLQPLLVFLLWSGARLSEALELEWRDVHLAEGFVVFRVTKNGETRSVPLAGRPIAALANLSGNRLPHDVVFRRPDGQPYADRHRLEGGQIKRAFATACRRAGIADFTPHCCRHTWATWAYNQTRDLLRLKRYGGWKSSEMVERYAHLVPDTVDLGVQVIPPPRPARAEAVQCIEAGHE